MPRAQTPHQIFLAPLAKLALRHPDVEGQPIWYEDGDWHAQDDAEAMIDGEEIAFYAEGLLAEGFGLQWQILAEVEAPKDPVLVRLFLWETSPAPAVPNPDEGWHLIASASTATS